jgi:inner membrane protein
MDNLTHTLLGLSIAKAGLERATPLATTTLIISSNLPDIDVLGRLEGGTLGYLEYHRGFTHGFVGLAVLAAALTLVLMFIDRRFRLRRDLFGRPLKPVRVFLLAYLGGAGHSFMDFTNSYGIRPLLPFSDRWFYGDIAFVVDPWIWLILGSALVWLTTTDAARIAVWVLVGIILSLIVGLALRHPYDWQPAPLPATARVIWFAGLALVITVALFRRRRRGARLARYSLLVLGLYYCGMWMAHQSALSSAQGSMNSDGVTAFAVWPTPANPLLWQATAKSNEHVYSRSVRLSGDQEEWREMPSLDPKLADALRQSSDARKFLDFMRFGTASVEQRADGVTIVSIRDLRFDLRMRVELDRDMTVRVTEVRWF